ncbi:Uncharacterised protein [Mycobacteroides abscessus subsp. abscessus]|nr:Uncharacterised protein [Mycobacteroides abscessus subsp. abscessus]SKV04314.1 Uncharacterised protein [Mycobacteroides abscessus subsp. abscessus]
MSTSLNSSPSTRALAMVEAKSSVGCWRRDAVSPLKYPKKSSSAISCSSGVVPRWNSESSPPKSSWVSLSIRSKSDSGMPSSDMMT